MSVQILNSIQALEAINSANLHEVDAQDALSFVANRDANLLYVFVSDEHGTSLHLLGEHVFHTSTENEDTTSPAI